MRTRKFMSLAIGCLLMMMGSHSIVSAGDNKAETVKDINEESMNLNGLSWLVGRWVGEGFGGECEEVWNPSSGGSMIGTFRLVVNGKAQFYELMTITLESGKPTMKVKHFNADLTGWEEKDHYVTFKFVSMLDSGILFDGLTYRNSPEDVLRVTVMVGSSDAEASEEVIEFHRVKL